MPFTGLAKSAPNLRNVEIRRPVNWGLGIISQNGTPAEWTQAVPKLALLPNLQCILLSIPRVDERPEDLSVIAAAREVLQNSSLKEERKLVIRRVIAPHYTNGQHEDIVHSVAEEVIS